MRAALAIVFSGLVLLTGPSAHGEEITKDMAWPADTVREVPEDLTVAFGATLTIEPGAEVRVGAAGSEMSTICRPLPQSPT